LAFAVVAALVVRDHHPVVVLVQACDLVEEAPSEVLAVADPAVGTEEAAAVADSGDLQVHVAAAMDHLEVDLQARFEEGTSSCVVLDNVQDGGGLVPFHPRVGVDPSGKEHCGSYSPPVNKV
jgi:hypothetical protein